MKPCTSIFALALGLFAPGASWAAAVVPVFASVDQSFYQSTGCSPHSESLNLTVTSHDLTVLRTSPMGGQKSLVLHLDSGIITTHQVEFNPGSNETKVATADISPDVRSEYLEALKALKNGVVQIKTTNGCFPDLPILGDIVVYLSGLMDEGR